MNWTEKYASYVHTWQWKYTVHRHTVYCTHHVSLPYLAYFQLSDVCDPSQQEYFVASGNMDDCQTLPMEKKGIMVDPKHTGCAEVQLTVTYTYYLKY